MEGEHSHSKRQQQTRQSLSIRITDTLNKVIQTNSAVADWWRMRELLPAPFKRVCFASLLSFRRILGFQLPSELLNAILQLVWDSYVRQSTSVCAAVTSAEVSWEDVDQVRSVLLTSHIFHGPLTIQVELSFHHRDRLASLEQWTHVNFQVFDIDTKAATWLQLFTSRRDDYKKDVLVRSVGNASSLECFGLALFGPYFALSPIKVGWMCLFVFVFVQ
jgi:hypothetical protein